MNFINRSIITSAAAVLFIAGTAQADLRRDLRTGIDYLDQQKFVEAVEFFTREGHLDDPSERYNHFARWWRAKAYIGLERYAEAEQDLNTALPYFDKLITPLERRAVIFDRGRARNGAGNYSGAIEDFDIILSDYANDLTPYAYGHRAWSFLQLGQHQRALDDYDAALAKTRDNPGWLHYGKGVAYFHLRDFPAAMDALSQSLRLSPSADAYYFRGESKRRTDNMAGALTDYEQALNMDSSHLNSLVGEAMIYADAGRPEVSLQKAEEAIRIAPTNFSARLARSIALVVLEKPGEALPILTDLVATDSSSDDAWRYHGLALAQAERYGEAVASLTEAVKRSTERPWMVKTSLASVLVDSGDAQGALAVINDIVSQVDSYLPARLARAAVFQRLGLYDKAMLDVSEVLRRDTNSLSANLLMADLLRLAGKTEKALQQYELVLQSDALNGEASLGKALTLYAQGAFASAASEAEAFLRMRGLTHGVGVHALFVAIAGYERAGQASKADRLLRRVQPKDLSAFEQNVVGYLRKEIAADSLIASALSPAQTLTVRAIVGLRLAATDSHAESLGHLKWVDDNANDDDSWYLPLVQDALDRLEAARPAAGAAGQQAASSGQ